MIGNDHFAKTADIKEPMEEHNDTMEAQYDVKEDDNVYVDNDEFGLLLISFKIPLKMMLNFAIF
jgi:hypothetical protein